jgi:uncharacterized protein YkwD
MTILYSKIGANYPLYKNWLVVVVLVFISVFLVVISSYAINIENADSSLVDITDNKEYNTNTDNTDIVDATDNVGFEFVITPSVTNTLTPTITVSLTNTPLPTVMPTYIPTVKPTIKPTSTVKPSPTRTNTPIPTNIVAPTRTPTPMPTTQNASCDLNYSLSLLAAINTYRIQNGKAAYSYDSTVGIAACNHSNWMLTTGIFSHTGINGTTASQRCALVGANCNGENITMGNDSYIAPATIVTRWSGSAPHNANMLGSYTRVGIGRNGNYVTVDFGY